MDFRLPDERGWNNGTYGNCYPTYFEKWIWQVPGTLTPNENYTANFGGTSAACPQVSGVAALILSLNSQLTQVEVSNILKNSADDMGTTGFDSDFGYGRVNAYQSLLLTHAYSNKSIINTATSSNSQRKIVRDGSGNYHIVFSSGGEIYYRKYTTSWQTPIKISYFNENNSYPSIALGSSNQIMIVWQRKNGSNYDIYFSMSTDNGSTWTSTYRYVLASSVSTSNPYPVITMSIPASRKTVLYSSTSGLSAKTTTTSNPTSGSWTNNIIGATTDFSPSLASCGTSTYNVSAYNGANNHVYYKYQDYNGSWSSSTNLSSMVPGSALNTDPTICGVSTEGSVHVAWTRYTYSNGYPTSPRTYYTKNSTANGTWPFQYWSIGTGDQYRPSISAINSSKVDIIYNNASNYLYKTRYNGSSWSSPTYITSNANSPSISIGSTQSKYLYTSGSSLPWTVQMSSETLSKEYEIVDNEAYYSRSIAFIQPDESFVEYVLHDIKIRKVDKTEQNVKLIPFELSDKSLTIEDAFSVQESELIDLDEKISELIIDFNINSSNFQNVVKNDKNTVSLYVKVEDESGKMLFNSANQIDISQKNENLNRQQIVIPILNLSGKIKIKTNFIGFEVNKGTIVSLGHLYNFPNSENDNGKEELQKTKEEFIPIEYSLSQNFPNPFNPTTKIKYNIPYNSQIGIWIYDIMGKEIKSFNDISNTSGVYELEWNGTNNYGEQVSSGIYLMKFNANSIEGNNKNFSKTLKLMLLK
ncbi:MAG: S8 family serine peptidase [Ignavibacteriae bacterium]|nr:S8 family serine peptidase [Ignavibacteriota bacterium]